MRNVRLIIVSEHLVSHKIWKLTTTNFKEIYIYIYIYSNPITGLVAQRVPGS